MHAAAPLVSALIASTVLLNASEHPAHAQAGPPKISGSHRELVRWIGYSSDDKSLASASFDGSIQLRDAGSGKLRKTLTDHRGQVCWGGFSKDGRLFASGGEDTVVRVWDLASGQVRAELVGLQSAAWAGAITPNAKRVISGGPDSMVFVWDVASQEVLRSFRHVAPVWWIDVSRDSHIAAVAGGDEQVTLYDLESGKALRKFGDHVGGIYCVAFSRDNSLIATAGADGRSSIWNTKTGKPECTLPQFGAVHAVAFSADGKQLATGGADYSVRLWNVDKGVFRAKYTGHKDAVWSLAFDAGGSRLASAGGDGKVFIWDLKSEPGVHPQKVPPQVDLRSTLRKYGLPVVPQGPRNTCSVHTFTRALEFAVSKHEKRGIRLSDEYLNWATNQVIGNTGPNAVGRGQFFEDLWRGYCKHGICRARDMPFAREFNPLETPSAAALQSNAELRKYAFVWRDITGPGIPDEVVVSQAKSVLARGWPLLAGSPHSLLVVGYMDQAEGGLFMVADSGTGGFIDRVTEDRLHSAIPYSRVKDYGFSWIEGVAAPGQIRSSSPNRN